jgi:hypothetical protein
MPKYILTARLVGIRKRGRPRKWRTDEPEENLKVIVIINWLAVAKDRK